MPDHVVETVDPLGRLVMFANALTSGLDASEIIEILVKQGMAGLGAEGGVLALVDDGMVTPVVTIGYPPEVIAAYGPLSIDQDLPITAAARDNTPIWISTRAEGLERFPLLVSGPTTSQAWVVIPVTAEGHTFGVFGVSFQSPHRFAESERLLLRALVDLSAVALHQRLASEGTPSPAGATTTLDAALTGDDLVEFLQRVLLHEHATSAKLASILSLPYLDKEAAQRLHGVIDELDSFVRECQKIAFSALSPRSA